MNKMALLLYISERNDSSAQALQIIQEAADGNIEMYSTIPAFTKRLREPLFDVGIAVLFAAGHCELMEFIHLAEWLRELKIILILPDQDRDTIRNAHRLRPRFIAISDRDFENLGGVLKKMMDKYNGSD